MVFGFSPEQLGLGGNGVNVASAGSDAESASGGGSDSYQTDRGKNEDIITASVNAEASLLQGGYNPAIANAVSASRGIGASEGAVEKAASEYARMAQDAVREGRPPESIRFEDPNLSQAARDAIYAEAAQQNGTTTEAIERKAAEEQQQAMQQLQQGILGGAVVGTGLSGAIDNLLGQGTQAQQVQQPQQQQAQASNPFGISQDVLRILGGSMTEMGSTTAALANNSFTPDATPGMEQRQRSGMALT